MPNDDGPFAAELRGVTKRFGAVLANDRVDLAVRRGEIHALVGENGAGKSTALAVLFGLLAPDTGVVAVDGAVRRLGGPGDALRLGLGMVHQHLSLVEPFTVAENVVLGAEPRRGPWLDRAAAARAVEALGAPFNLTLDPSRRVADLSLGERQWVELLKELHRGARTLLLDEPTAVLTPLEVDRLFEALDLLRTEGRTVVLVTHKLAEVFAVADRVTVMRAGRSVLTRDRASTNPGELAEAMIGRPPSPPAPRPAPPGGPPVLSVRGAVLERGGRRLLDGATLEVGAGEVLGIAGVEGNGQNELLEAIAGRHPLSSGSIAIADPARRGRIGFVPGDRRRHGLVLDMTVLDNAILGRQGEPRFTGRLLSRVERIAAHARALVGRFDVRPPSIEPQVGALSGGNQQKVVVGRELEDNAGLLLVAQPTRGVDVGAIEIIHAAIREERDRGAAILLVSSDLDELLALCDRIVVMFRGVCVGAVDPRTTTPTELGLLMTGGSLAGVA